MSARRSIPIQPSTSPIIACVKDVETLRVQSRERLKRSWESIFERYGKDFEDEADEIDIRTGRLVVDRGFVRGTPTKPFGGVDGDDDASLDSGSNSGLMAVGKLGENLVRSMDTTVGLGRDLRSVGRTVVIERLEEGASLLMLWTPTKAISVEQARDTEDDAFNFYSPTSRSLLAMASTPPSGGSCRKKARRIGSARSPLTAINPIPPSLSIMSLEARLPLDSTITTGRNQFQVLQAVTLSVCRVSLQLPVQFEFYPDPSPSRIRS
ncbi:hypothetical protein HK101_003792 [Irineochytrium annulatum]|nr:hypothetical protein HK101_003792 [Irineochytrium annulatum]